MMKKPVALIIMDGFGYNKDVKEMQLLSPKLLI